MERLKFAELNCSEEILQSVNELGFEEATPIQTLAIPVVMDGKDVVGQAQTGTGKTAAFGIPALDKVDVNNPKVQCLVLCPTRELAVQVSEEFAKLGKYKKNVRTLPVFGGQDIDRQIRGLRKKPQIIIGTPGRVMDHMRRKTLKLDELKMLILDEADEMLKMGFREDIETILEGVKSEEHQTLLFSATMPKAILEIINTYQKDPEILKVAHKELTTTNVEQVYLEVKQRDKIEVLSRLIDLKNPKLSIVFCNTKKKVDEVTDALQARGYMCDKIHGDMKQTLRINVINKFKRRDVEILVATDVAARGLDIDDVEAVFNFDIPSHEEYYVHRIGRTGRAGRTGTSYSFATSRDYYLLKNISRYTKSKIHRMSIPKISDIEVVKKDKFFITLKEAIEKGDLEKYMRYIEEFSEEGFSVTEIAAALLKLELELQNAQEVEDIKIRDNSYSRNQGKGRKKSNFDRNNRNKRNREYETVNIKVNVGKNKNIQPKDIVGAISGETGLSGKFIGDIDIHDSYTVFEIPKEATNEVIDLMNMKRIKGNRVKLEVSKKSSKGGSKGGSKNNSKGGYKGKSYGKKNTGEKKPRNKSNGNGKGNESRNKRNKSKSSRRKIEM